MGGKKKKKSAAGLAVNAASESTGKHKPHHEKENKPRGQALF